MNSNELAQKLSELYHNAIDGKKMAAVIFFGYKYAEYLQSRNVPSVRKLGLPEKDWNPYIYAGIYLRKFYKNQLKAMGELFIQATLRFALVGFERVPGTFPPLGCKSSLKPITCER
ncbi:hypothetical protein FACS1894125_2280 [Actinomycetota bacterium]|nr:hypothetical protein FACS1894125_2280 [Actinomycetota bacterium]